jgi:hypothetical protein
LAVTTLAPCSMARRMSPRAGSIPPITSTTMSARSTSASASAVNASAGRPVSLRSRPVRRTATPTISSGRPTRAARSAAVAVSSRATDEPTTPQPSRATRNGSDVGPPAFSLTRGSPHDLQMTPKA